MQLDLPFTVTANVSDPPIDFVRVRRARKYILRVRHDGTVRVTVPRGGSRAEAMRFVERHLQWIVEERLRVETRGGPRAWEHGTVIMLAGRGVAIEVTAGPSGRVARYADRVVPIPDGALDVRPAIEADLKALAREILVPRLRGLAAQHGLHVERVGVRNQRSRWGSCSRAGSIALNFRLVQMPAEISDYVLIHELMHLEQQNHGPRFWRLVAAACPAFRDAERWLRTEGRRLF